MKKLLSVVTAIAVALALLTGAVAVPTLVRPIYYAHITALDLPEKSGMTQEEIIDAYDEVLDYCTGVTDEFSAGILPFSAEGADHFKDCRQLFLLDYWLFAASMAVLAAVIVYARKHRLHRFLNRGPAFWGATGLSAALLIVGTAAATNFDKAFTLFHTLFFPGKDNWVLYANVDPIIRILPEEFFRNCAIVILGIIVVVTIVIVLADMKNGAKNKA